MREAFRLALAALSFLTVVPVPRGADVDGMALRRGAVLFPVVGAGVGALVATVSWAASLRLPAFVAAVLGVAVGVVLTAALHLDGLGDVADAMGASLSGASPEEALRDPRLGTFGVVAVASDLLLRVSVVAALLDGGFPWAVVAAGALSRVPAIALAWRLPYVGRGAGGWTEDLRAPALAGASALALAIAVPAAGLATLGMVAGVVVATFGPAWWARRQLGGATGDVFGATTELAETLGLVGALAAG